MVHFLNVMMPATSKKMAGSITVFSIGCVSKCNRWSVMRVEAMCIGFFCDVLKELYA